MKPHELLATALRLEPGLTPFGLGKPDGSEWKYSANLDWDLEAIRICYDFCQGMNKIKSAATSSSYGWKHRVEEECGRYIPNGAFIAGALAAGFEIKRRSGPNAVFNIGRVRVSRRGHCPRTFAARGIEAHQ